MAIAVGLDFGTTNSCVSYYNEGTDSIEVIRNHNGEYTTRSCIGWNDLLPIIGDSDKSNVCNFKRLIGLTEISNELREFYHQKGINLNLESNGICVKQNTKSYTVNELVSLYISELLSICSDNIGEKITDLVITVPVKFTSVQRQCLIDACVRGGFNVLRLLNEPTAAALAAASQQGGFSNSKPNCETVLVFDCGGGTTDISVIEMDYEESIYDIKYTYGFPFLGGEDMTKNILGHVMEKYGSTINSKKIKLLQRECEKVKEELSYKFNSTFCLESGDKDLVFNMSRVQFENVNRDFFLCIEKQLEHINKIYDIEKVILVGGSSRIPYFKMMFRRVFGNVFICDNLNPDYIVSKGAALQARQIQLATKTCKSQKKETDTLFTLFDVTNMSLGVEISDGVMCHIISKNTTIPVSQTHVFTNSESYTDSISIKVYQGERKLCKFNTFLTEMTLQNLDKTQKKGEMRIKVTFSIDVDGIVHISAIDSKTQHSILVSLDNNVMSNPTQTEEDFVFHDTSLANKIFVKNELYDTFVNILTMFHSNNLSDNFSDISHSQKYFLNQLFRKVMCFLAFYEMYTVELLIKVKSELETEFHNVLIWNVENCSDIVGGSLLH
jgi:L1 cell adhesion molecule like protein